MRESLAPSLALFAAAIALASPTFAADLRFPPSGPGYLPPAYLPAGAAALERLLRRP